MIKFSNTLRLNSSIFLWMTKLLDGSIALICKRAFMSVARRWAFPKLSQRNFAASSFRLIQFICFLTCWGRVTDIRLFYDEASATFKLIIDETCFCEVSLIKTHSKARKAICGNAYHQSNWQERSAVHAKHKVYDDKTVWANSGIENFMMGGPQTKLRSAASAFVVDGWSEWIVWNWCLT